MITHQNARIAVRAAKLTFGVQALACLLTTALLLVQPVLLVCLFGALGGLFGSARAEVPTKLELAALFVDHMVVQRDRPIPVWGWAVPGKVVTARMAGQEKSATANERGRWQLEFTALPAGGPHTLEVEAGEKLTVKDVLVGEVWICSGQSNMDYSVAGVRDALRETAEANFPQIRMWHQQYGVSLEPREKCVSLDGKWVVCAPTNVGPFSAVGYFFARDLHRQLKVPIGMISTSWGATSAAQWTSQEALAAEPQLKSVLDYKRQVISNYVQAVMKLVPELQQWKTETEATLAKGGEPRLPTLTQHLPADPMNLYAHLPTGVFNMMLHPLTSYSIRGVIWYQGEQDTGTPALYTTGFPTMIRDWRQRFRNPDLPFLYVQIATINAPPAEPQDSNWALLREAQFDCLAVPHTAMAVSVDLGEANNPHPSNKQDVGKRLALAARATVYGEKVVYQGPTYQQMKIEKDKVRIHFDHIHGGLVTRDKAAPQGFAIAGADKKFVWAKAKIDGDTVLVWNEQVTQPVAVRYAWADMPLCNLLNKAVLPAVPFRTDRPAKP